MFLFIWKKFFRILWIYFSIYGLVYNYLSEFLQSFLKTRIVFPSFRNDGKSPLLIETLSEGWPKFVNMSAFSLIILVGTSISWQALEAYKQTIYCKISFFPTFEKLSKSLDFGTLSIAFILGWFFYFKIAFYLFHDGGRYLLCKSMGWFLYDIGFHHERIKQDL